MALLGDDRSQHIVSLKFLAPTSDHQTKMAQGQLLESTYSFEIFAHGSKYLLVNENWWDIEKILSRLDNGISNG